MAKVRRPKNVDYFEWIAMFLCAFDVIISIFVSSFDKFDNIAHSVGFSYFDIIAFKIVSIGIYLMLVLLVTRRRSVTGKWIFLVFSIATASCRIYLLNFMASGEWAWIQILKILISIYMIYLLFSKDFNKWIVRNRKLSKSNEDSFRAIIFIGLISLVAGSIEFYRIFLGGPLYHFILNDMSKSKLKHTIISLEYYKLIYGKYPKNLNDMKISGLESGYSYLWDASAKKSNPMKMHQYQVLPDGRHYTLYDVGPDGISGTADDLFPEVDSDEAAHIGYVRESISNLSKSGQ